MSTRSVAGLLMIAVAITIWVKGGINFEPGPGPSPDQPEVIEVPSAVKVALESGLSGKGDEAAVWAGLLNGLANFVEADGKTSQPLLTSLDDISELVQAATRAPLRPMPGGVVIGQALGPQMAQIGGAGDELSSSKRESVVRLLRGSAQVLEGL